jgi:outer membrane lipoprotein carrier protein
MTLSLSRVSAGLLLLALLLPVLFAGQAQAQDRSAEVINRLRAAYTQTDALRAQFTQEMGGARMEGTLVLSGDRYRIETPDQILVTDGTTAWAYSKDDNQVLVNRAIEDVTAFSPSTFFTRYPEHFRVAVTGTETIGGTRHDVLRLTPHDAQTREQIREVTLFVRTTDSLPTRVELVDGNGSTIRLQLQNLERNPRLDADTFRFRPPAGAEVVDLR